MLCQLEHIARSHRLAKTSSRYRVEADLFLFHPSDCFVASVTLLNVVIWVIVQLVARVVLERYRTVLLGIDFQVGRRLQEIVVVLLPFARHELVDMFPRRYAIDVHLATGRWRVLNVGFDACWIVRLVGQHHRVLVRLVLEVIVNTVSL